MLDCQHHSDTLQLVFPIFQQLSCSTVDINSIDKCYICYIILQHAICEQNRIKKQKKNAQNKDAAKLYNEKKNDGNKDAKR